MTKRAEVTWGEENATEFSGIYICRAMLTADLIETTKTVVELHGVDAESMEAILTYMYTATVNITNDNAQNIFTTASLFEMLELCETCAEHMVQELCLQNCVSIYQFASFHHCQMLQSVSKAFVISHFAELFSSSEIRNLCSQDLAEIIKDDNLNVKEEITTYNCVKGWLAHSPAQRGECLTQLLPLVRFSHIPIKFIEDSVLTDQQVVCHGFCKSVVKMARLYHIARDTGAAEDRLVAGLESMGVSITPRLGMFSKKMMVFVGGTQDRHNRALTCYDPATHKNYYAIPLHISFDFKYRIDHHRIVVTDKNEIFLVGGIFYEDHHFEETGLALSEVRQFDAYRKCWNHCAPLLEPRCAHTVVHHGRCLYVIGGKTTYPQGEPLSSVECYDIDRDRWNIVASLPVKLCHHCSIVHDDSILVLGGLLPNNEVTNLFLEYNIMLNTWSSRTPAMQIPRAEFGMALLDNKLYVIGGTNGNVKLSTVEILPLETTRWQFGDDFPEDRKSMVTVVFDGCIFVCGGVRTLISRINRAPRLVETKDLWKLDPKVGLWQRDAKLVQFANVHACVVADVNTKRLNESEFISHP